MIVNDRIGIGIDIDDVLAEFHEAFIAFCNTNYGTTLQKDTFTSPKLTDNWGIPLEELLLRANAFEKADAKRQILPRPGAQAMIARLKKKYNLYAITNRPIGVKDTTIWWLDEYFSQMFTDVIFCTKDGGKTLVRSKNAVCKALGIHIMLEDHPHNTYVCANDGIHTYLFDQPWNRQEFPLLKGVIIRVDSWYDEILETLFGK